MGVEEKRGRRGGVERERETFCFTKFFFLESLETFSLYKLYLDSKRNPINLKMYILIS